MYLCRICHWIAIEVVVDLKKSLARHGVCQCTRSDRNMEELAEHSRKFTQRVSIRQEWIESWSSRTRSLLDSAERSRTLLEEDHHFFFFSSDSCFVNVSAFLSEIIDEDRFLLTKLIRSLRVFL